MTVTMENCNDSAKAQLYILHWPHGQISQKDKTMSFYNEKEQLYLEVDESGVDFRTNLLQVRDRIWFPRNEMPNNGTLQPITFASKILTSAETQYKSTEKGVLGILSGLEKFHHYIFACEVSVMKNYKPLVAIFKKDLINLSQRLKEYYYASTSSIRILYKPRPRLLIAEWLSRHNHEAYRNEKNTGNEHSHNCHSHAQTYLHDSRRHKVCDLDNEYLSMLSEYVLSSWPSIRAHIQKDLQLHWSFVIQS